MYFENKELLRNVELDLEWDRRALFVVNKLEGKDLKG